MTKRRATVLTPAGHDVTSAGSVSILLSGKAEDADPARLGAPVPPDGTIRESNDVPDLSAPAGRVLAAGICGAMLALGRTGVLDHCARTGDHFSFDPTFR